MNRQGALSGNVGTQLCSDCERLGLSRLGIELCSQIDWVHGSHQVRKYPLGNVKVVKVYCWLASSGVDQVNPPADVVETEGLVLIL